MRHTRMRWTALLSIVFGLVSLTCHAATVDPQDEYERSISAVVRNKTYYKEGSVEAGFLAGVMPYDSQINHYLVGGQLNWNITDHLAWQILDLHFGIPTVTSFSTGLAQDFGVSNMQMTRLKLLAATNIVLTPLYAKIRFLGRSVLHFDAYLVLGGGLASTDTLKLSSTGVNVAATESVLRTGMEPMFDFGIGFKMFMNRSMGIIIDLRDYVVYSETYGNKALKSNFALSAGLIFFIPPLG